MSVDVVVVGGGPAGLAAGLAFARYGVRTLVLERRDLPADKPCGEGIMPSGVADLGQLGVARAELEAVGRPFRGVRYVSPEGHVASAPFVEGPGVAVRRTRLSACLAAAAARLSTLEIRTGCEAHVAPRDEQDASSGMRVVTNDGPLEPALVVVADGLHSRVRRALRWPVLAKAPYRWGARQHFAVEPWTDQVEVYWADGAEAYVTPVGPREVGVAFLWDRDRLGGVRGGADLIPSFVRRFPALAWRLDGVAPCSEARATGPLHHVVPEPAKDGVVLVGDAAGYVDAVTGEGLGLAFAQGLALASAVAPSILRRPSRAVVRRAELEPYVQQARRAARYNRWLTQALLVLSRHPRLVDRSVRALAHEPALLQHLFSANMGRVAPWRVGMASAWHLVRELVAPREVGAAVARLEPPPSGPTWSAAE